MTTYRECHDASVWVEFTLFEWRSASLVGVWIWEASHSDGRSDRDSWRGFTETPDAGKKQQALGSLAERIAAKALGIYWPSAFNNFAEADLPHNVEVRLIGVPHYGLRVYPRNDDSRRVIGVVIPRGEERALRYRVAGWILAGDAKREEWSLAPHGRPPMFAVPQDQLRPVGELQEIVAEELLAQSRERSAVQTPSSLVPWETAFGPEEDIPFLLPSDAAA
jgi:hypothetical protein